MARNVCPKRKIQGPPDHVWDLACIVEHGSLVLSWRCVLCGERIYHDDSGPAVEFSFDWIVREEEPSPGRPPGASRSYDREDPPRYRRRT